MADQKKDIRIEFPAKGGTYCYQEYGVYEYGVYPKGSVLAGQPSRRFLNRYPTLEEAQREHPDAKWKGTGSHFSPPQLNHLPTGPDPSE